MGKYAQSCCFTSLTWVVYQLVVFITCFAVAAQVFVVVAAGSVIAFIIRDLGDAALAGWIIQVRTAVYLSFASVGH
jgi:hypothetical protein